MSKVYAVECYDVIQYFATKREAETCSLVIHEGAEIYLRDAVAECTELRGRLIEADRLHIRVKNCLTDLMSQSIGGESPCGSRAWYRAVELVKQIDPGFAESCNLQSEGEVAS